MKKKQIKISSIVKLQIKNYSHHTSLLSEYESNKNKHTNFKTLTNLLKNNKKKSIQTQTHTHTSTDNSTQWKMESKPIIINSVNVMYLIKIYY